MSQPLPRRPDQCFQEAKSGWVWMEVISGEGDDTTHADRTVTTKLCFNDAFMGVCIISYILLTESFLCFQFEYEGVGRERVALHLPC